jgi:hypothetical protein
MIERLKQKYPSDNPLVEIQLGRIAKLNVQLTRIQQLIDAAFLLAGDYKISDAVLMDRLQMNETEKINANRIANEDKETEIVFDLSLMELAIEIGQVDTETFESPQDFLTHTPRLCEYLYVQASILDTSISEYISSCLTSQLGAISKNPILENYLREQLKWRQKNAALEQENAALKQGVTVNHRPTPAAKTKEEMILALRVKELQKASQFMRQMISDRLKTNHKLYAFSRGCPEFCVNVG